MTETPGSITMGTGRGGLEVVTLTHRSGSTCQVYRYGAHVTSWKAASGRELLFLSERAQFVKGTAIRGGIPVIFPQFSGQGPLPAHGIARNREWKQESSEVAESGDVRIVFSLEADEETRAIWNREFAATLTVTLNESLALALAVENRGAEPFEFQSALHTYFRVADVSKAGILGLRGVRYVDFLRERMSGTEERESITLSELTDRAYVSTPDRLELSGDPSFVIEKTGMKDAVVWNPWKEKAASFKDMAPDEYTQFLCVETGNVENRVALEPGQRVESLTRLTPRRE